MPLRPFCDCKLCSEERKLVRKVKKLQAKFDALRNEVAVLKDVAAQVVIALASGTTPPVDDTQEIADIAAGVKAASDSLSAALTGVPVTPVNPATPAGTTQVNTDNLPL